MADPASDSPTRDAAFSKVAGRAVGRINAIHFFEALKRLALPVFVIGFVVIVALRVSGVVELDYWVAGLAIVSWLGGAWFLTERRKPNAFSALARWDESAGRKEVFASAQFFEGKETLNEGEKLHVERARKLLDDEGGSLAKNLPLPPFYWEWVLPILLVAFALSSLLKPTIAAEDQPISEEMKQAAAEEAKALEEREEKDLSKMEELTDEEKEKYKELKEKIDATAEELKRSDGKSAREILEELEKRARDAEKLAEELGLDDGAWASAEMLAEMRRHPDTTDLAEGIKDKDAGNSAEESDKVAERLEAEELTTEVRDRVDNALSRTMKKANEDDKKKIVGRHVGEASVKMERKQPKRAAKEFRTLAKKFRRMEEREKARKELEELAKKLREAGNNIAGKNLKQMKSLAGNKNKNGKGNKNQQNLNKFQNQPNFSPLGQQMNMPMGMPIPGLQVKPGQMTPGQKMIPGKLNPNAKKIAIVPGTGKPPKPGQPMIAIPIPGQLPGAQPMGVIPGAGAGGGMQGAGAGGNQAGNGSAPHGNNPTKPFAASREGVVAAQQNANGESTVRSIEGQAREENASRDSKAVAVGFLKVQEEALDEASLPASRREHVRRYFKAIRESYETAE